MIVLAITTHPFMDRACRISNVSATQRSEFIRGTVLVTQLLTGAFVCLGVQRVISSTSSKWATSLSSNFDRASLLRNRPGREVIHQEHLTRQGRGLGLGFVSWKIGKRREGESALEREATEIGVHEYCRILRTDQVAVYAGISNADFLSTRGCSLVSRSP